MNPAEDKEIERIKKYEQILDETNVLQDELEQYLEKMIDFYPKWKELISYYESKEYREDLKKDEEGYFPLTLKRGIFSEDAIYDTIYEDVYIKELLESLLDNMVQKS